MKIERIDLPWVYTDDGKQIAFALIIGNREVGAELYEDKDGFYLSSWNDVEAIDADVTDTNVGKMTEEEAIEIIDISPAYIGLEKISKGCSYDEWRAIEALQFQQSLVRCGECKHYIKGDISMTASKKICTVYLTYSEMKPCPFCGGEAWLAHIAFNDKDVWYHPECSNCSCGWQENYETTEEAIARWNTRKDVEFQETIVRCKDCKHCVPDFEKAPTHICVRANRWPKMDDFCSWGERRDEE